MKKNYFNHLSINEREILENKGTEPPFSGEYNDFFVPGIFMCKACKSPLYESRTKFNSGCGWPSFDAEIHKSIIRHKDLSSGIERTEICCAVCEGHLGHVFTGEKITNKDTRHCVNSLSIEFKAYENLERVTLGGINLLHLLKIFKKTNGIFQTSFGYMGENIQNLTLNELHKESTNHNEVIDIYYDSKMISLISVLQIFFKNDITSLSNRKLVNKRNKHKSVIFYYSNLQKNVARDLIKLQFPNLEDEFSIKLIKALPFYRVDEY